MPEFSVVMPAFNQASYIQTAIDSVRTQTLDDWELIVVDDGSTDLTPTILDSIDDPRIRVTRQARVERAAARNAGVALARGAWLAFLDADDAWHPRYLECQRRGAVESPGACLVGCGTCAADINLHPIECKPPRIPRTASRTEAQLLLLEGNCFSIGAVVAQTAAIRELGGFDPELRQGEDWDLWLRLVLRRPIAIVEEPLFYYRLTNDFLPRRIVDRGDPEASLHIVSRAWAHVDDPAVKALQASVMARHHLRAAWISAAVADRPARDHWLELAVAVHPYGGFASKAALAESLAHEAVALRALFTPLREGLDGIHAMFDQLPPSAGHLRPLKHEVTRWYAGLHVFHASRAGAMDEVRRACLLAIASRSSLLGDRGFWSLTARAWLRQRVGSAA